MPATLDELLTNVDVKCLWNKRVVKTLFVSVNGPMHGGKKRQCFDHPVMPIPQAAIDTETLHKILSTKSIHSYVMNARKGPF